MVKKGKRVSLSTKYTLLVGILLLLTNITLGVVMMHQSTSTIRNLVQKNMLSISNTAAALIDGGEIEALTKEDVGSPAYNKILRSLSAFQSNVDIEYIYAVRQDGEDHFIFTVDADPEDPADFGDEVLVTDALRSAAKGTADVDDAPAQDAWGNFYSSYSPIFNDKHEVAGIVGVDFDSEWYEKQLQEHSISISLITLISIVVGALLILYMTGGVRRQFKKLNEEIAFLSADVDELANELASDPRYRDKSRQTPGEEDYSGTAETAGYDEIDELGRKIHSMHGEISEYLDYVHKKAYTDALTHVGNSTAYLERHKELNQKIHDGKAAFSLAVFDINNLKTINDRYGHACGDRIIRGTAGVIAEVFGVDRTYRIGGDEFLVISENDTEETTRSKFREVDERTADYNAREADHEGELSISMGAAEFDKDEDTSFQQVFIRADEDMYRKKEEYHNIRNEEVR